MKTCKIDLDVPLSNLVAFEVKQVVRIFIPYERVNGNSNFSLKLRLSEMMKCNLINNVLKGILRLVLLVRLYVADAHGVVL